MTIAASNVAPDFRFRRQLHADDLKRLTDPALIFEHVGIDSDGERFFCYSVGGWLDGENVATLQGGATVGGDVIVVHADTREQADAMAGLGLEDTINALNSEGERMLDALVAKERLRSVGALERMDLATKALDHPAYVEDINKLRPLVGDDIVLATHH